MKKFPDLSSWSRWSLSLSRGAVIGSIQHVIASTKCVAISLVLLAFLAACDDSSSASAGQNDEPGMETSSSAELGSSSSEKAESSSSVTQGDVRKSSSSEKSGKSSSSVIESSSSSVKSESTEKSSSSEKLSELSSSSADKVASSSSVVTLAMPCKTETEDNCEYGTLLDDRDGQTYKTVKIGAQWWMAENLNFVTENSGCGGGSGTTEGNCETYGRLYSWAAAMGKSEEQCGYGHECDLASAGSATFIRGVCPDGWHVPTQSEWSDLFAAVGGKSNAGKVLKSQTDWYNGGNGSDAYGFAARPAGSYGDGRFSGEGNHADFWSSTENGSYGAYDMYLTYARVSAHLYTNDKDYGYSVRCVKD